MRARPAIIFYLSGMALLTVAYFAAGTPRAGAIAWALIAYWGTAAILFGAWLRRPDRRLPWVLFAIGAFALGTGDSVSLWIRDGRIDYRSPGYLGFWYLTVFACVFTGLILLSRTGIAERDRAGLLDAFTLAVGAGLPSFLFLVAPRLHTPASDQLISAGAVGYPLGMLLMLALVARLAAGSRPSVASIAFVGGILSLAVGQVIFLVTSLRHPWRVGTASDLLWIGFYTGWGIAALHPSMTGLGGPRTGVGYLNLRRLVLLSCCALLPSILLLAMALTGTVRFPGVIGFVSTIMVVLVLARLMGVLRQLRAALRRERKLRAASGALLGANTVPRVEAVIADAVDQLFGNRPHRLELILDRAPAEPGSRIYTPTDTPAVYAAARGDHSALLAVPLAATDPPGAALGTLLVAGGPADLARYRRAVEILAGQAQLALTQIQLGADLARRDAEMYFQTMVYHASDAILIVDDSAMIRYRSPSALAMFGERSDPGRSLLDIVEVTDRDRLGDLMLPGPRPERPDGVDWQVRGVGGRKLRVAASWRDLRRDPSVGGYVLTLRDVTEQRRLERELRFRAHHDPLTALANRTLFTQEADQAALRRGDGRLTAVLLIDLDNFKEINDTLGHIAGDHVLTEVAARLTAAARPGDTAARLGGDEFALLMPDVDDIAEIDAMAERVVAALRAPVEFGTHTVDVSASVGVATSDHRDGFLLSDADQALYQAKRDGKGQWRALGRQRLPEA